MALEFLIHVRDGTVYDWHEALENHPLVREATFDETNAILKSRGLPVRKAVKPNIPGPKDDKSDKENGK